MGVGEGESEGSAEEIAIVIVVGIIVGVVIVVGGLIIVRATVGRRERGEEGGKCVSVVVDSVVGVA